MSLLNKEIEDLNKKLDAEKNKETDNEDFAIHHNTINYRYSGSWILNSNYIYNYGRDFNIQRKKENGTYSPETELSITMIAPNIYDGENKSLVERAETHALQISLIRTKIQQLYMASIPPGVALELSSIDNVIKGKGGNMLTPTEMIRMFRQIGSTVYRRITPKGTEMNGDPIKQLPNGIPPGMDLLYQALAQEVSQLDNVMGMNDATNASTPSPDALVGVQKMQAMGTAYTLQPLQNAFVKIATNVAEQTALMVQDLIEAGQADYLIRGAGFATVDTIKAAQDTPLCEFGINIEYLPDAGERQEISNDINTALQAGALDIADAMRARRLLKESPEQAERWLIYKMKKYKEDKLKESQQMQSQNGQIQMQSNMAAEQAKQKIMSMEYQLKMQLEEQLHKYKMEEIALTNTGKLDALSKSHESELLQTAYEKSIESKLGQDVSSSIPQSVND